MILWPCAGYMVMAAIRDGNDSKQCILGGCTFGLGELLPRANIYLCPLSIAFQDDCPSCSIRPVTLTFHEDATLQELYDYLCENQKL